MLSETPVETTQMKSPLKSADPSACGILNSICFDSKSEVKRSEKRSEAKRSEAKRKRKRSESESEREAKSEASRSEAID